MWKIHEWNQEELSDKYVAFAIDNFGNLICFDVSNNHVVFLELEMLNKEYAANSFTEFLEGLYQ